MAEKKEYKIQAKVRTGRGKNDARRVRRDGLVPVDCVWRWRRNRCGDGAVEGSRSDPEVRVWSQYDLHD